MILLDTNVVSGLMRREPDRTLIAWLDGQPAESIWTTSVTVFEIRMGLDLLAPRRRRTQLQQAFEQVLADELEGRVQPFDQSAAVAAGSIAASHRRAGRGVEIRDVQIAGVTAARKATLATGNARHFEGLGIDWVDPWST